MGVSLTSLHCEPARFHADEKGTADKVYEWQQVTEDRWRPDGIC